MIAVETEQLYSLAPDEVLVRVEAAGLNHIDSLVRSGRSVFSFPFPYGVGVEGAGVVMASGEKAELTPGMRVCWTGGAGSCATYVVAKAALLMPLPDQLSFEAGASIAHAGFTASGLMMHWPLQTGATVLVWGAAGAVGQLLVAALAARGINVIGIASGSRVAAVTAAGAALAIDREREDVIAAVKGFTDGHGVAAIYDPIGLEAYETNMQLLAPRGCLINYGQLSGALPTIDLKKLMSAGSVFVTKYGPRAVTDFGALKQVMATTLELACKRPLASGIAGRFRLEQTADAYRLLDSNAHGKVLVLPHQA